VAERVAALHLVEGEALDEVARRPGLLEDLDRLAGAHHPQLGVALAQPGLDDLGVRLHHDHGVAGAQLGLAGAEALGERVAHGVPVLARVGREERHLGAPGRRRLAVERHAGAVGAAVAQLHEHRAEVTPEVAADVERLGEKACDSAHGPTTECRQAPGAGP
jgi:hypothetical protein